MSLSAASSATSAAAQATTTVVAVLGGGISGLAAAYYTARRLAPLHHQSEKSEHPLRRNNTRLALFERADRLGGWIHTTRDPATGALLEHGPRSIRPKAAVGEATLDLICALGIDDQVVRVPASSPAASKRYLYDQDALVALPASLGALIGSRMGRTLLARGAAEPFRPRRPTLGASITTTTTTAGNTTTTNTAATAATAAGAVHHGELAPDQDESVHQFFARRFGGEIADSLATALCRGIYAGDARELSVNACFPFLGQAERDYGSVVMGMLRAKSPKRTAEHPAFVSSFRGVSMISFREGLKTLPCALESHLESAAGVRLARSTAVSSLKLVPDGIEVRKSGDFVKSRQATRCLSFVSELWCVRGKGTVGWLVDPVVHTDAHFLSTRFRSTNNDCSCRLLEKMARLLHTPNTSYRPCSQGHLSRCWSNLPLPAIRETLRFSAPLQSYVKCRASMS
ncbi:protoporphyrinogen oxidase, variant 2 [Capsaspora owczarzaki ATCC 30864]|uniref:Protoporphyrinogen oxidase, variant 2 n=1 Tax=Capsaspora owczarzaki (strain ATCC 30864) TaxID=595528 RepID=A0A0D2UMI7_CAPO3|nr:protoporphyrinogen oxidase, variant 2 [Capsaspora owczarzaki ATCC 30864]